MTSAKKGDVVRVHYSGKFEDGTVFDTSNDSDPLEFTLGEGKVIPGFEAAVDGMNTGESKTIQIPALQAYGPHLKEMVMEINRDQLPENLKPEIGRQLHLRQANKQTITVTITNVTEDKVTIDANHPLAGKDLTFDIQLVEIA